MGDECAMGNYIVIGIIVLFVIAAVFRIIKSRKNCKGCIGCPMSDSCNKKKKNQAGDGYDI